MTITKKKAAAETKGKYQLISIQHVFDPGK